ncbi:TPA: hypothetical protein NPP49_000278 [Klebsiella variicola subsp. variicola]|nr:hypothetical protein [Klebsiella variicola subsp. variicola]HCI6765434.1 hypothetical protein [Klebsiella variicola subsp. variicola]
MVFSPGEYLPIAGQIQNVIAFQAVYPRKITMNNALFVLNSSTFLMKTAIYRSTLVTNDSTMLVCRQDTDDVILKIKAVFLGLKDER